MLNYLIFGIAIIIFATVIIISGKAISRGIEAKQNMKNKSEDEKIAISDTEENANISNSNPNFSNSFKTNLTTGIMGVVSSANEGSLKKSTFKLKFSTTLFISKSSVLT